MTSKSRRIAAAGFIELVFKNAAQKNEWEQTHGSRPTPTYTTEAGEVHLIYQYHPRLASCVMVYGENGPTAYVFPPGPAAKVHAELNWPE